MSFKNLVRFNAVSPGLGNFVVDTPVAGCVAPESAFVIDGKVYDYVAKSADGLQFEYGQGAYVVSSHSVARTVIFSNSNKDQAKVDFALKPIVDVFPSAQPALEPPPMIVATTQMLFLQTAAPTGWTKITTHNDKSLRIVSGSVGSGGTNSFSTTFASRTSDATTLSTAQMPSHTHSQVYNPLTGFVSIGVSAGADYSLDTTSISSGSNGSNASHTHGLDMRVQYVDAIIAQKD